jgi:hypothetical protein
MVTAFGQVPVASQGEVTKVQSFRKVIEAPVVFDFHVPMLGAPEQSSLSPVE